jgi:hypothetical protein
MSVRGWIPLAIFFALATIGSAHAQSTQLRANPPSSALTTNSEPPMTPLERCRQAPRPVAVQTLVSTTVNPATRWQPRGGTIIVAVTDTQAAIRTTEVIACLYWNTRWDQQAELKKSAAGNVSPNATSDTDLGISWTLASVMVRQPEATDKPYTTNLGIVVPDIEDAPYSLSARLIKPGLTDAFGVVPVAHLRLIGLDGQMVVFDADLPVGITSHWLSSFVFVAIVALALLVVFLLSKQTSPPKASGRFGWILDVIKVRDGTASLSSLQMLLWTILVIGCAAYVMTLSGTLIDITGGTLTLLGIAGATRLTAAYTENNTTMPPMPITMRPQWSDVVRSDNTGTIDITRIQMLLFTLLSASFVVLAVLTTYVIPDIPSGYQVLMGISNGIYVGRKLMS